MLGKNTTELVCINLLLKNNFKKILIFFRLYICQHKTLNPNSVCFKTQFKTSKKNTNRLEFKSLDHAELVAKTSRRITEIRVYNLNKIHLIQFTVLQGNNYTSTINLKRDISMPLRRWNHPGR